MHRRPGVKKVANRTALAHHAQRVSALKSELAELLAAKERLAGQACSIAASEAALSEENKELVAQLSLLESSVIKPPCWEDLIGDSPPRVRYIRCLGTA